MRRPATLALALGVLAGSGSAQTAGPPGCPPSAGLSLTLGASAAPDARPTGMAAASVETRLRAGIDTAFTFDVAERRWSRERLDASLAAAVGGGDAGAPWSACAGARVSLDDPTLVIRGARGTVRLRLSLDPLVDAARGARHEPPRR